MNIKGKIESINISKNKGQKKTQVEEACINKYGIEGDGHSGEWHRQISLLSWESIQYINTKGVNAKPGDFAENLTISGIDLKKIKKGDILFIEGEDKIKLMVTQIGKDCHKPCKIFYHLGYCIMPREGIFCKVLMPGKIKTGDDVLLS